MELVLLMRIINDYNKLFAPLSTISFDKDNEVAMVADDLKEHRMINFDGAKKQICKNYRSTELKSCDGMLIKDDCRYLIEFKNQSEGNITKDKIKDKAFDSVALISINENKTREEIAQNTIFILVYNNEKYEENPHSYAPAPSMDKIAQTFKRWAKLENWEMYPKKFDTKEYIGTFYKNVYTVDLKDFMATFFDKIFE